jgi:hypothetical protein
MRLIFVLRAATDCARAAIATIAVTRIFIWNDHVRIDFALSREYLPRIVFSVRDRAAAGDLPLI